MLNTIDALQLWNGILLVDVGHVDLLVGELGHSCREPKLVQVIFTDREIKGTLGGELD